ncbi:MAG TPA: hypothetical protein VKQ36_08925 [Ktedonobacterales bacterium]|nr:hypothetical protein [Ktedonobacterales bacterium]
MRPNQRIVRDYHQQAGQRQQQQRRANYQRQPKTQAQLRAAYTIVEDRAKDG